MSRIPMPLPFGQSLMQGLTTGSNIASQLNQANIARQQLAMQQQMNPVRMAYMQALTKLSGPQAALYSAQAQQAALKAKLLQTNIDAYNKAFGIGGNSGNNTVIPQPPTSNNQTLPTLTSGTASDMNAANSSGNNFVDLNSPPSDIALPLSQQPNQQSAPISQTNSSPQNNPMNVPTLPQIPIPKTFGGLTQQQISAMQRIGMPIPLGAQLDMQNYKDQVAARTKAQYAYQIAQATAQAEAQAKTQSTEQTQQFQNNLKMRPDLQNSILGASRALQQYLKIKKIVASEDGRNFADGGIFGPGSSTSKKFSNNMNYGYMQSTLPSILGTLKNDLGQTRTGKYVLQTLLGFKPGVDMPPGQVAAMIANYGPQTQQQLQLLFNQYKAAGGDPEKEFPDAAKLLDPKLFKDAHWGGELVSARDVSQGPNAPIISMPYYKYKKLEEKNTPMQININKGVKQ